LYIKALFSYSLKMVSWQPKHCSCCVLLIKYILHNKVVLHYKLMSLICDKCHNSKFVIFQEKYLKVVKCYNFLRVQRWHNCSPAASFAKCIMTLYLLKVELHNFSFYTNNSKMPNFELWHSCCKWAIYSISHLVCQWCGDYSLKK